MFEHPFQGLVACCAICSAYTVVLEHAKHHIVSTTHHDAGRANLALSVVQSTWNLIYGTYQGAWSHATFDLCLKSSVLYALNIWCPIAGQYFGVDGLTLLLLRASSPFFSWLFNPARLSRNQKCGVLLAMVGTVLASVGGAYHEQGSVLGMFLCLLGTLAACLLGIEQNKLLASKKVSREHQLAHMHLFCAWTFFPALHITLPWLVETPFWITFVATMLQWLCSLTISSITEQQGAVACQITLTVRRGVSSLIVAAIYAHTATVWHWLSLACALVSAFIFDTCGKVKLK